MMTTDGDPADPRRIMMPDKAQVWKQEDPGEFLFLHVIFKNLQN